MKVISHGTLVLHPDGHVVVEGWHFDGADETEDDRKAMPQTELRALKAALLWIASDNGITFNGASLTPTNYDASMDRLAHALATNDQEWLAANYPGAWPWPVSGGVAKPASHQGVAKPEAQPFDADAHDQFMKSLG